MAAPAPIVVDATIFTRHTTREILQDIINRPDEYIPFLGGPALAAGFDLADFDVNRQVTQRNNPAYVSNPPFDLPLINAALENPDTPDLLFIWIIPALRNHAHGNVINNIYAVPQTLEPPLHVAARHGHTFAVDLLLTSPNIDLNVVYSETPSGPRDCAQAGHAHAGQCQPNGGQHGTSCMNILEASVRAFASSSDPDLKLGIRLCASMIAEDRRPGELFDQSGQLKNLYYNAISSGMNNFVIDQIDFYVNDPIPRQNLLDRGLEGILYPAAAAEDNSSLVEYVLELATNLQVLPMPSNPSLLGVNPIAAALENRHPNNAVAMIEQVLELCPDLGYDPLVYLQQLFRNSDIIAYASMYDENHDIFTRLMAVMQTDEEYIIECADYAFRRGAEADQNLRYAVTHFRFLRTVDWLWAAIHFRHLGYIRAVLSLPEFKNDVLDEALPAVPAFGDVPAAPEGWTFLGAVVEARMLLAIILLLNHGANAQVVSRAEWGNLLDHIHEDWDYSNMSRTQFVSIYMEYDFFEGDDLRVGVNEDRLNGDDISGNVELVLRAITKGSHGLF
ncbi:hypothetical protein F4806DRAFT_348734 [Annulohypoxylon nitens]|nr:hypothetical protein F4806DRAFT_348734 [Annulohypoxylon nitens]